MNQTFMPKWHELGERIRAIQERFGREFKAKDIINISNPNVLVGQLLQPDHSYRVAYAIDDVCFIQMKVSEENWVVCKGLSQFDAITSVEKGRDGLLVYLLCVLGASESQCRNHQFLVSDTYYRGYRMMKDYDIDCCPMLSEYIQINH